MKCCVTLLVAGVLLAGCQDPEPPDPEFTVEGCSEEVAQEIEDAASEACTVGRRHMLRGTTLTAAQKEMLLQVCELSVAITVTCKACDEEDPNPCAYSQPDLPLLQGEDRVTTTQLLEELQSRGGIRITLCKNADGSVPSRNCAGAVHKTRDLRSILLHELNHYVVNDPTHSSTTWTDVEEVDWDGGE